MADRSLTYNIATVSYIGLLEEASTHKSAISTTTTHISRVFVPRDLDFWQINGIPGHMVEHYYVTFGDTGRIGFWDIVWKKDRQTHKRRRKPYQNNCRRCG